MKAIKILGLLTLMSCMLPAIATAQDSEKSDSTGLPGDNFSLEGALELFKNAGSLEDFEKSLNQKSNNVNNLDLNNDGKVDYVKVTDKVSKDVHAIILRINVNAQESQDVAVIAVEKNGDKSAVAQIIGDKELYGDEKVVEPIGNDEKISGSKGKGPSAPETKAAFYVVNVWYWPCVQYMYDPFYDPWNSPWYWGYYPSWWYAWEPYPWYYHHHHCAYYSNYHHVVYVHRVNHGPVYNPYRQSSTTVQNNYRTARQSSQSAVGGRTSKPVERQSEVNKNEPVSRPVEGTQGLRNTRNTRENREITPERQNPSSSRPVERQNPSNARPVERQNVEPQIQRNPRMSSPERTSPQRSNPQVSPQQRAPQQVSPPRSNPPQIRQQSAPGNMQRRVGGRR